MHRTRTLRGPLQGPHATSWNPGSKEHVLEIQPGGGGRNSPGQISKSPEAARARRTPAGFAPRKFSGNIRVPVWGGAAASLGKTRRSGLDEGGPGGGGAGRRDGWGADRGGGGQGWGAGGARPQSP